MSPQKVEARFSSPSLGDCRYAVGRGQARPADPRRAPAADHGRELRPHHGCPDLQATASRALSPSAALVVRPWKEVSFYGNFIEGLQPGTVVGTDLHQCRPGLSTLPVDAGRVRHQDRLGQVHHHRSALFQISQPSAVTNFATNTLHAERHAAQPAASRSICSACRSDGVRLLGGAMFLEGHPGQHRSAASNDGWQATVLAQRAGQPGRANGTRPSRRA